MSTKQAQLFLCWKAKQLKSDTWFQSWLLWLGTKPRLGEAWNKAILLNACTTWHVFMTLWPLQISLWQQQKLQKLSLVCRNASSIMLGCSKKQKILACFNLVQNSIGHTTWLSCVATRTQKLFGPTGKRAGWVLWLTLPILAAMAQKQPDSPQVCAKNICWDSNWE